MFFGLFDFFGLRVGLYLGEDGIYFLHFEVYDVVHDALCLAYMLPEKVEIEFGLCCERIFDVAVKVDCEQAAAVIRA